MLIWLRNLGQAGGDGAGAAPVDPHYLKKRGQSRPTFPYIAAIMAVLRG